MTGNLTLIIITYHHHLRGLRLTVHHHLLLLGLSLIRFYHHQGWEADSYPAHQDPFAG